MERDEGKDDKVEIPTITQEEEDSDVAFCPFGIGGQNLCLGRCALYDEEEDDCGYMLISKRLEQMTQALLGIKAYLKNI